MGKLNRIKRRLVSGAIADNLEMMRGFGPWSLERGRGRMRVWIRRAYLVILPTSLVASSILVSAFTGSSPTANPEPVAIAAASTLANTPTPHQVRPAIARPAVNAGEQVFTELPKPMDISAIPFEIRRVVLDAGHGGTDPGTVSGKLLEKDMTLDVSVRLKRLLEAAHFEVQLTRATDATVPLRERARIANESGADIFVSVHVNSIRGSHAIHGIETYYLGPTDDPLLTELAASENRGSGYTLSTYRKLLERIYTDVREGESHRLAESIQRSLHHNLAANNPQMLNWGVRKAPFVVLVATEMPAILAEIACLSNEQDARLLATEGYRQEIAESLFKGIVAYAESREGKSEKGI